jgi:hypothetical protein
LFGCLVVWLFGCLVVWLFGCLVVWLFGCLVVWLFGCLVVWLFGSGSYEEHEKPVYLYESSKPCSSYELVFGAGVQEELEFEQMDVETAFLLSVLPPEHPTIFLAPAQGFHGVMCLSGREVPPEGLVFMV